MEWLIVGLGNPGARYQCTRHNVGFMVADALAREMSAVWQMNNHFRSELAEIGGYGIVKPLTYMNLSGDAVGMLARFYKISPEKIVVIHDDLDLGLGIVKAGFAKGPKVHNGLRSVETVLATPNFWRVRVGIEDRTPEERYVLPGERYVLMPLSDTELTTLRQGIHSAIHKVAEIISERVQR